MPKDYILRIAVCDDSHADRSEIVGMTVDTLQEAGLRYEITEYDNAPALLAQIQKGVRYDILLLDVMMDEMTGMELAAQLRRQENKTIIIFISVNREMALCGYEVNAARFLAKPLDPVKMKEAMDYCVRSLPGQKEVLLPLDQGTYRVKMSDIQYVEAFDRGTRFVLKGETVESRLKFSEAETLLPKNEYVLCHRSFMVRLACVKYIRRYQFELKSGKSVDIGRGRYQEVYHRFMDYIAD